MASATNEPHSDPIHTLRPGWKQIVMVCKACEKRSKAPKKFGAKQLAKALSSALRQARQPKTRVVQTTCMGLCPKKAIAVSAVSAVSGVAALAAGPPGGAVRVIAWRKSDKPADALQALLGEAAPQVPSSTLSHTTPQEQT
ncbi:MAG: hypothetical protein ABIN96_07805 [Rubrivivax sp.]